MKSMRSFNDQEWFRRLHLDVLDSLDEEIEMEAEDREPGDREISGKAAPKTKDQQARQHYFRELFRLQGELVNLQEWAGTQRPQDGHSL